MLAGRTVAVVMPAYNEAQLIRGAIDSVPNFVDRIIVVDDGSTDATNEIARASARPIVLIEHDRNRGVGAAVASGCMHAVSLEMDLTAVMAADGQMDPADLPGLLAPLISREADFVKGNRLAWPAAAGAMPWHRWLGNHLFSWLTRRATGVRVEDSQCGYVAMNQRSQVALDWERLWKSYGYPNDLISRLTVLGMRVHEVAVRPIYGAERSGIRLRHVLLSIPFVLMRAWARRRLRPKRIGSAPPQLPRALRSKS